MKHIRVKMNKPYIQKDLHGNEKKVKPPTATITIPEPDWMPEPAPCPTCGNTEIYFYFETGWLCSKCNRTWFRNREFDRTHIFDKVLGILDDLYYAGIVYVSNGTEGDCIRWHVTGWAVKNRKFSTDCIIEKLMETCSKGDLFKEGEP